MKGIIILEGPDATGKSTLARRLAFDLNGIILHQTYRFKDKIHLYHIATMRKALKLAKKQVIILDRLHLSENIYAKVYRNGSKWPWLLNTMNSFCRKMNIPTIICLPYTLDQGLKWFNKAKDERPEMYEDIKEVIQEYINFGEKHIDNKNFIAYNREDNDNYDFYYDATLDLIKVRLNEQTMD